MINADADRALSRRPMVLLASALALLGLWYFGELPGDSRLLRQLYNAAHFPVFGLLGAVAFFALRLLAPERLQRGWRGYAGTLLAMLAISVLTEASQSLSATRSASAGDAVINMMGTVAALGLIALRDPELPERVRRPPIRIALIVIALALALSIALTVVILAAAFAKRQADFPCVVCPDSRLDLQLVQANGATVRLSPLPEPWRNARGDQGFEVHLRQGVYPGLEWADPMPDWRGFATLALDMVNPEPRPLRLTLRVDDAKHNGQPSDRFNYSFMLPAGARHREYIPLSALWEAPEGRDLDLSRIARIVLFGSEDTRHRRFYLHSIRLQAIP